MRCRAPLEPPFDLRGQIVISRVHVAELRIPECAPLAPGNADGVEHVRERDLLAVGHIGVPALSGIGEPDRLAIRRHVGQHYHFWKPGLMELIGHVDLKLAKHTPEAHEMLGREPLLGKAKHTVSA